MVDIGIKTEIISSDKLIEQIDKSFEMKEMAITKLGLVGYSKFLAEGIHRFVAYNINEIRGLSSTWERSRVQAKLASLRYSLTDRLIHDGQVTNAQLMDQWNKFMGTLNDLIKGYSSNVDALLEFFPAEESKES